MPDRLFVYGSLAPGGPNHHMLARIEGSWTPASVRGRLVEAGWGAEIGYPGMVLDAGADPVAGYVFASDALAEQWDELDAFEGEQYERVTAPAQLADGTIVETCLYVLRA